MSTLRREIKEVPDRGEWTVHKEDGTKVKITLAPSLSQLVRLGGALRDCPAMKKSEANWTEDDLAEIFDTLFAQCGEGPREQMLGCGAGAQMVIAKDIITIAAHAMGDLRQAAGLPSADPTSGPSTSSSPSAAAPKKSKPRSKPSKKTRRGSSASRKPSK